MNKILTTSVLASRFYVINSVLPNPPPASWMKQLLCCSATKSGQEGCKKITLEKLALQAAVSKGQISQIENNRTTSSLLVLVSIIRLLEEDFKSFLRTCKAGSPVAARWSSEVGRLRLLKKEGVAGSSHKRTLAKNLSCQRLDLALMELKKGAGREHLIQTDAFECKLFCKEK